MRDLVEVLREMDTLDDDQWTADGAPKIDYLKKETGNDSLARQDVIDAAPHFTRSNPEVSGDEDAKVPEETQAEEVELLSFLDSDEDLPDDQQWTQIVLNVSSAEDLQDVIDSLKDEEELLYASIEFVKERAKAIARLAMIAQKRKDYVSPPPTEQEQRMTYIRAQNEMRAKKARALSGIDLAAIKSLDPRSKLDQVMSVRRQPRGRPTKV